MFTAARRKEIEAGAAVIWHGNALQKDWREQVLCGRQVSSLSGRDMGAQSITQDARERKLAGQREEQAFFDQIGVSSYLPRAGQEPWRFGNGNFTLTVADMARFGVGNVTAPPGYGTTDFCAARNRAEPAERLYCLQLTDELLAYEQARRSKGEACTADGRLFIPGGWADQASPKDTDALP